MYNVCLVRRRQLNASEEPPAGFPFSNGFENATWQDSFDHFYRTTTGGDVASSFTRNSTHYKTGSYGCAITTAGNNYVMTKDLSALPTQQSIWFKYIENAGTEIGFFWGCALDADPDYVGGIYGFWTESTTRVKLGILDANGAPTQASVSGQQALTNGSWYYIVGDYTDNGTTSTLTVTLYAQNGTTELLSDDHTVANGSFSTEFGVITRTDTSDYFYMDDYEAVDE